MVKPGFSHSHMEKWDITIATKIPLVGRDGVTITIFFQHTRDGHETTYL